LQVADQIAFKVVYVRAKDGGNPRPFPIVAKDLSASNDSDNLAGHRIADEVLRHALSASSDVLARAP
jgi:hypothetical protein